MRLNLPWAAQTDDLGAILLGSAPRGSEPISMCPASGETLLPTLLRSTTSPTARAVRSKARFSLDCFHADRRDKFADRVRTGSMSARIASTLRPQCGCRA